MSPCPRPGCNGVVSLRVSRGTSHPENQGCSYEACGIPGMQESHFIRWRHDILRHNIPSPSKNPLALGASLHDLLQIPLIPHSVLPFHSGGSSQPHTPTRKHSTLQDSAQAETLSRALNARTSPLLLDCVPDSEIINNCIDQLQLANDTVGVTNLLHALEQAQSEAEAQTLVISNPAVGIEQLVNETNDSNISHTQFVITKQGQAEERCNGPNCQTSKRQVPAKHAQTCTHRYCKKCCLEFQSQGARKCSLTSHKLKGSESVSAVNEAIESENATSSTPTATSGKFQRPLREDHYLAQLNASQKWGVASGTLIERRVAEESLKKTLNTLYWKNNIDPPQPLTLTCPTFPVFSISSCTPAMQKLLDCTAGSESLIEAFDPQNGSNGRWCIHDASTPRDISVHPFLLYHAIGVSSAAIDMSNEIDKLLASFKSKKRPLDSILIAESTPNTIKIEPSIISSKIIELDSDSDPEFKSVQPLKLPKVSKIDHAKRMARKHNHSNKSSGSKQCEVVKIPSEDEDTASSAHAKWPLKFVQPMANRFKEMDMMKGSVPERFTSVFRLPFPGSKATYYSARNAWDAATDAQKDEYIDASLSSSGLWKDFVKEVTASHSGTIPKKRLAQAADSSGRHTIYCKDKDLVSVKKEEETNITFSSEIIFIDN